MTVVQGQKLGMERVDQRSKLARVIPAVVIGLALAAGVGSPAFADDDSSGVSVTVTIAPTPEPTSPEPTEPAPSPSVTQSPKPTTPPQDGVDDELAKTGGDFNTALLTMGALALAGGAISLLTARKIRQ